MAHTKLIFSSVLLATFFCSYALAGELLVVTSAKSSLTTISGANLRYLYLGKSPVIDNRQCKAFMRSPYDSEISASFLKSLLNTTPDRYKAFWLQEQLRGGAAEPEGFSKLVDMVEEISSDIDGICYVSSNELNSLDEKQKAKIKTITIR